MTVIRPDKNKYYLDIAVAVAKRGTCLRRNYGAVIVNNDEIVGTGYSGSPRETLNCCDNPNGCQRDKSKETYKYELCMSTHAEVNAIISAGRSKCMGAILYLVGIEPDGNMKYNPQPCFSCSKIIINSGIKEIRTPDTIINVSKIFK